MRKLIAVLAATMLMATPAMAYTDDDLYELSHIINAAHPMMGGAGY